MIKMDLTDADQGEYDQLLTAYAVKGVPTVMFLDRSGRERDDLRLVDFIDAGAFLIRMVSLK